MGVLDEMTKGITERKAKAAGPKLTPVGVEASPTKPSMPKDLPGRFMAAEEVTEVARDLRERAEQLVSIANALDAHAGTDTRPQLSSPEYIAAEVKKAERAADARVALAKEREFQNSEHGDGAMPGELPELDVDVDAAESFKERLDRLSAEAQAAVFMAADATDEEAVKTAGWACPEHGSESLKQLTSRQGRKYMACQAPGCKQFEKA